MNKKNKKPSVTVLIPSHNEGKKLTDVIASVNKLTGYNISVLVVISDKASTETKREAKNSGVRVVSIGKIPGKGRAVRLAIPHIVSEYVIQIDADYQFLPEEIPLFMNELLNGYDVVLGTRYQKGSHIEPDSVTYFKLIGSYGLSLITSIFARKRVTDVMAGFKGFKTAVLKELDPKIDHFGYEAELVVRAAKKKYKIINVPISYRKRTVGSSSVSSIKHGLLVLGSIIKTAVE